jgi:Ca-activated chloride channel family protein
MKRFITILSIVLLLGMLLAQTGLKTNSIIGKVTDNAGRALARVSVQAHYLGAARASFQTQSNNRGNYRFDNMQQGYYRLVFTHPGFETVTRDSVMLLEGAPEVVDVRLSPARAIETTPVTAPRESVDISESLSLQGGAGVYKMPMASLGDFAVHNTEEYSAINPNIFHSPLTEPLSTFSIDVDTATYSNVRRMLNNGQLPDASMIRIEELVNYFSYDYPEPRGEHPFSIYTEYGECPWNTQHQLVHIGLKGRSIDLAEAAPSNLVFLIDVSGSMMPENKLPLVQRSLTMLVDNLRAQDRIGIVVYASGTRVVLPSTPGDQKLRIKEAINTLTAGGSTAGAAGIQLAYDTAASSMIRGGNNRVILCTDGDFNVGLSSMTALEELVVNNRNRGIFLTVLGYGMGNYKDNKIELLANRGNGNYAYIDTIMEAKKVLVNEIGSTLYTIAKDVKIQAEFNPAHVRGYRLIGYENRLLRPEEFRDDTVDAGELGAGHTVTAIYEIIPSSSREPVAELDSLRYQSIRISPEARQSPELMTVKLRYKEPDGETSIPLDQQVLNRPVRLRETSERYRFSAAVVGYGLMLQNSRFKGNLHWEMVKELAANSMSSDPHGYKAEFMELIQKAIRLGSGD